MSEQIHQGESVERGERGGAGGVPCGGVEQPVDDNDNSIRRRHPRSPSPGLATSSSSASILPSSRRDSNVGAGPHTNTNSISANTEEDEENQPLLVRYDDLEKLRSELQAEFRRVELELRAERAGKLTGDERDDRANKPSQMGVSSSPSSCLNTKPSKDGGDEIDKTSPILRGLQSKEERKEKEKEKEELEPHRLPEDTYGFLICCNFISRGWWFGLFICCFQIVLFVLFLGNITNFSIKEEGGDPFGLPADVEPAVRVAQIFAILISVWVQDDLRTAVELAIHRTFHLRVSATSENDQQQAQNISYLNRAVDRVKPIKWFFSAIIRGVEGSLSLFVSFVLIIQAYEVFDLMLNFTAILFLSELDDVAFRLSKNGYFGNTIKKEANRVINICYYFGTENEKTFYHYYQSASLMVVLTILYIGFGITVSRQESMEYFQCEQGGVYAEFGDLVDPYLGIFSGTYKMAYEGDKRDMESLRVIYENEAFNNVSRLGYCYNESRWTLFDNFEDPCDYLAKSSVTDSFDIMGIESGTWYSMKDIPLEHIQLLCSNDTGVIERIERCQELGRDAKWCSALTISGDELLNGFPLETGVTASYFQSLENEQAQVHNHPVYWGQADSGLHLIMFTGRRWVLADTSRFPQLQSAKNATYIQDVLSSSRLHASQFPINSIMFITDTVDAASDACSPVGLTWHHAIYSKDDTNSTFPSPDLRRSVSTQFSCAICNRQTNPCKFEGICNINGTCDCQHGSTGSLCEVAPLKNGKCNNYFNTRAFQFDGGDCCGATCDAPRCGLGELGFAFGTDLNSIRQGNGFPNCKDDSMVSLAIVINCPNCYQKKWNAELELECEGITYLQFRHEGPMARFSNYNNETVKVKDGAKCNIRLRVNYRAQYHLRISQEFEGVHLELLETDLWFEGLQPKTNKTFSVVSTCLLKDLYDNSSLPAYNSSQHDALVWMNNRILRGDTLPEFECHGLLLNQLYALVVLYYSFDNNPVALQNLEGWLSLGFHCDDWNHISCNENFGITHIKVENFDFDGTLPTEIGYFSDLVVLWLEWHELAGSIPSEVGELARLELLRLANNQLTGNIPSEVGKLTGLTELDLHSNDLSGPIPSELGLLTKLTKLYLGGSSQFEQPPPESVLHLCENETIYCGRFYDSPAPTTSSGPTTSVEPTTSPTISMHPTSFCLSTNRFQLNLTLDEGVDWGGETTWDIRDEEGELIYMSPDNRYQHKQPGSYIIERGCLEDGSYNFNLYDSYGDGFMGDDYDYDGLFERPGSYELIVGGAVAASGMGTDLGEFYNITTAFDVPFVPSSAPTDTPTETCSIDVDLNCTVAEPASTVRNWYKMGTPEAFWDEFSGSSCESFLSQDLSQSIFFNVGFCGDYPFEMTFQYNGGDCSQTLNSQPRSLNFCDDFKGGNPTIAGELTFIQAFELGGGDMYFQGLVPVGGLFSLNGPIGASTNISFWDPSDFVTGDDPSEKLLADSEIAQIVHPRNLRQTIKFSSDCFETNFYLFERFGSVQIFELVNKQQGYVGNFFDFTLEIKTMITADESLRLHGLVSDVDGIGMVNRTEEVNNMVVDSGGIIQVLSIQATTLLSSPTTYNFQTTVWGETDSGNVCYGQNYIEFTPFRRSPYQT